MLGAVIAGGQSRRFGSDKAVSTLGGLRMIDHVIAGLAAQVHQLVICGRDEPGYRCIADRPFPDMGPLGGLAAALHHARVEGFSGVLTSACDTPLVPPDLARRLGCDGPAIVTGQPLFGYWPASLSEQLDNFLVDPANRAVRHWADVTFARTVRYSNEIPNINTVAALDLLRLAREESCPRLSFMC